MISVRHIPVDGSAPHLLAALSPYVSRQRWFRRASTPFVGSVSDSGFRVSRVIRGRDSWNPVLYGRVIQDRNGTSLRVLLTFHPVVWVFQLAVTIVVVAGVLLGPAPRMYPALLIAALPWIGAAVFFPGNARAALRELNECLGTSNGVHW